MRKLSQLVSCFACVELTTASSGKRVFHAGSRIRNPRNGVPLIFTLSLSHLVNLIFRLPAPNPTRLTTGGTPATTPPVTPREAQNRLQALAAALAQAQERIDPSQSTSAQRLAALTAVLREREEAVAARVREDGGTDEQEQDRDSQERRSGEERRSDEEEYRRIPGDYWTSRP